MQLYLIDREYCNIDVKSLQVNWFMFDLLVWIGWQVNKKQINELFNGKINK